MYLIYYKGLNLSFTKEKIAWLIGLDLIKYRYQYG